MLLPPLHIDGPDGADRTFAFAHGAGVGMNSGFMDHFAESLGARGIRVARFEFPYMRKMRADGTRRPPDRADVLLDTWMEVVNHFGPENLFVGGKSMGGRVASYAADQAESSGDPVAGLICLGFPFHGPGKPEAARFRSVDTLLTPTLILQGTRDPFGTRDEVPGYPLSEACEVVWLEDGDHSFEPRKTSGRTTEQNWMQAIDAMADFMEHKS